MIKKVLLLLMLAMSCQLMQAQSATEKIFKKYESMSEGILTVEATGQEMAQLTKDDKEKAVMKKVDKIRILHTATKKIAASMEADFKSLEGDGFTSLTNDKGQTLMVKYGTDKATITEAVFYNTAAKGTSLAFVSGKLNKEEVKVLSLGRFM
ncbi:MAG: DUF4252 domain-containing protein [Prevotella sp.]|nr:DUF4252 domain-containing protein [Prevotella sp.]